MSHEYTRVDLTNGTRSLWLVKIPKYIAKHFEESTSEMQVAALKIKHGKSLELTLELGGSIDSSANIPMKHKLKSTKLTRQTLEIFSQIKSATDEVSDKLFLEGEIKNTLECFPLIDDAYMKMKVEDFKKAAEPQKKTLSIAKPVNNYKPLSDCALFKNNHIEKRGVRKIQGEKDTILECLFEAFDKHQYYTMKDLKAITNQNEKHLKTILDEYCNFNRRPPHKNTYELKTEFRYYPDENKE